jgi:hypothetical protein
MSDDRTFVVYAERRALDTFEGRDEQIWSETRVLRIQDDERELEVYLP